MSHFTPLPSLLGGIAIGAAAAVLLLSNGRVAGISGICAGMLGGEEGDSAWRWLFVGGLLVGGLAFGMVRPAAFQPGIVRSAGALALAGFLVGSGARLANGCTSGHGLCGLSRLSPRSFVAVGTFMATGALTVLVVSRFFGGAV